MVRSTVELGRSLSRLVVAEGVERPEQRQMLWEMGCRAGQGHLFGQAMPVDDLLAVLVPGAGGVLGRVGTPVHAGAGGGNVIDLPRARRPEADEPAATPAENDGRSASSRAEPDGRSASSRVGDA